MIQGGIAQMMVSSRRSSAASSLLTGLVVYYKLENTSDSGPNGLTLTNNGGTTFIAGKVNNCAHLVASSNQELKRADNAVFQMGTSTDFTLAFWIKYTANPLGGGVGYGINGGGQAGYGVINNSSNTLRARIGDGTNFAETDSASGINDGNWHLVILTVARAGNAILYIDNPTSETSHISMASVTGSLNNTAGFAINVFYAALNDQDTDEVGLWNRVITAGERATLYNGGSGTTYPF